MGMEESVLLLACPSWGWKNQFYFLLAQVGQRRIGFTSCLPMMGRGEFSFSLSGLSFFMYPELREIVLNTIKT